MVDCHVIEDKAGFEKKVSQKERGLTKIRHGVHDILIFQVDNLKLLREIKKQIKSKFNVKIRNIEKIDGKQTVILDIKNPIL